MVTDPNEAKARELTPCPQCNGNSWNVVTIHDATRGPDNGLESITATCRCSCCGWKNEAARVEMVPEGDGRFRFRLSDPTEDEVWNGEKP